MTESAAVEASAGDQPTCIGETATDGLENENIQPVELTAEEQIKILKAKIKYLEEEVEHLGE